MEQSVGVEENHQKSGLLPSSKPSGSHIRVDSLYIDLAPLMDNPQDSNLCDHNFSIREYVSEMREKDISVCLPFPTDNSQNDFEEQRSLLPPLDVVKFKWWNCDNCLREIGAENNAKEIGQVPESSHTGSLSKCSCSVKDRPDDAIRGASALARAELNGNENLNPSRDYNKEKSNEIGQSIADGSENDAYYQMLPVLKDVLHSKLVSAPDRNADGSDAIGRNALRNKEIPGPSFRGLTSSNIRHLESNGSSSAKIVAAGTSNTPNNLQRMDIGDYETRANVGTVCGGDRNINNEKASINQSVDDLSSESSDKFAEKLHHGRLEESSSKTARQRPPKVRLLAEILGPGGNANNNLSKTTDSLDSASDFCDDMAAETSAKQHLKGKRKITQDEKGKPPLLPKKSKLSKGGSILAKRKCMVVDSETEESNGAFVPQKNPKNHALSKNKHKQTQQEGGYLAVMPRPDVAKKNHFGATDGGLSRPSLHMPSDTEVDHYDKRPVSLVQEERQSYISKKKNIQYGTWVTVLEKTWGTRPGESASIRKDSEAYGRKDVGPSLNTYKEASGNGETQIAETTIGVEPLSLTWNRSVREGIPHAGESSIVRKSAPDLGSGRGLMCDLNETIASPTHILDLQNAIPRFGKGSFEHHREMNMSNTRNSDPKTSDQERGSEDIPMEIVELMAKNQYDRRRHEFERNYFPQERVNEKRNFESIGSSFVNRGAPLKSYQVEGQNVRMPVSQITAKSSDYLTPMNSFSHVNETHLNMNLTEGTGSAFARCSSIFDTPNNPSSRVIHPEAGSIRSGNSQNHQWPSGYIGSSFPPQKFRYSTVPNHMTLPTNYAPPASGFGTSSQVPEGSNRGNIARNLDLNFITENYKSFEKNRDVGFRSYHNSSIPFASKHRGFDLNATASGSLDLQSNEAIPAMQLLSLMDAGMRSNSLSNSAENYKMISRPFPSHAHHSKTLDNPMPFPDHYPKEQFGSAFWGLRNSAQLSSSSSFGKSQLRESLYDRQPPLPAFGPFSSPFQHGSSFHGANGIPTGAPPNFREKNKGPAQNSGHKLPKSVQKTGASINNHGSGSQRGPQYIGGSVLPNQSLRGREYCHQSRNPADFSVPEPKNKHMIHWKDLRYTLDGKKRLGVQAPIATNTQ